MIKQNITEEIKAIFMKWPIWYMLGTQDIKMRYRRSSIGPFWITISMAVTVYSMGFLYGHLFKMNIQHYFPFLTTGMIGWALISTMITEASNAFIDSENYIRNQESFFSLFMMRLTLRNLIIFLHNLVVFVPIILFLHLPIGWNILLIIPGLFIVLINAVTWGSLLGMLGTRYRDFSQIIASIVQVIYFLTPIMWMPSSLPKHLQWAALYNPFNQFLDLIRDPLLNQTIGLKGLGMVLGITVLGFFLYCYFVGKFRNKIVFWL